MGSIPRFPYPFTVDPGALDHFVVEAVGGGAIGTQTAAVAFNIQISAVLAAPSNKV